MGKPTQKLPVLKDYKDPRSKYDWEAIRKDYIYGTDDGTGTIVYPKPKELEKKYDVPAQMLSNRVTREKWLDHRKAVEREQAIERQKEHSKRLAKKAVKFDEQAANDSYNAEQILGRRIAQISKLQAVDDQRINDLVDDLLEGNREIDKELRDELKPLVSSYELESIMKAYTLAQDVGRKAMGITDDKPGITINNEIHQVQPTVTLRQADELRNQKLFEAIQNSNIRIPGITDKLKQLESKIDEKLDDTIDAEVVEEDDDESDS